MNTHTKNNLIKTIIQAINAKELKQQGRAPRQIIAEYFQANKNQDSAPFAYADIDTITGEDVEQVRQALLKNLI